MQFHPCVPTEYNHEKWKEILLQIYWFRLAYEMNIHSVLIEFIERTYINTNLSFTL